MRWVLLFLLLAAPAFAVQPGERLADPGQEARAREISKGLRCLVCRNESIDESNADLARDLRLLVRERIAAGDSNQAAVAHIVARYGDYVLLNPPLKSDTLVLWFGPAAVLLVAGVGVGLFLRRRRVPAAVPLSAEEQARLDRMLRGTDS